MKTNQLESIECPNCEKNLGVLPVGLTAGKVRKRITECVTAHLPHCKKRGAALVTFADMFGSAGKWGTLASLFKMLHDDEVARSIE